MLDRVSPSPLLKPRYSEVGLLMFVCGGVDIERYVHILGSWLGCCSHPSEMRGWVVVVVLSSLRSKILPLGIGVGLRHCIGHYEVHRALSVISESVRLYDLNVRLYIYIGIPPYSSAPISYQMPRSL